MVLYLAIDTSGSMEESDKRLIARSIVLFIAQYCRLGYAEAELRLLAAGVAPRPVEWNAEDEYPESLLDCGGTIDMQVLADQLPPDDGRLILVTDGSWATSERRQFDALVNSRPVNSVRIVKVGSEPVCNLQAFEAREMVFDAENILEALDGWLEQVPCSQEEADEW